jgi:hypothetical protein
MSTEHWMTRKQGGVLSGLDGGLHAAHWPLGTPADAPFPPKNTPVEPTSP